MESIGTWWMWAVFLIFVFLVLGLDIFLLGKSGAKRVSVRHALLWVLTWFLCATVFGLLLWGYLAETQNVFVANQKALEFFTGYLIEETLSTDNMFTILMIFTYFLVPAEYQRRVLLYGVLGAIVFRLLMILGGVWLVSQLHWILYVFGLFLVFTGAKMFFPEKEQKDLEKNPVLRWSRRFLRVTKEFHNEKFFIKKDTLYYVTPLFLVLILVEVSDLVFALDSIPAIFAVTNDVFIIFTSNIFAILGLRALYFLLVNAAERFHFLKYGIAVMLIFIGLKMLIESWIDIPILLALGILVLILGGTVMLSLLLPPKVSAGKK